MSYSVQNGRIVFLGRNVRVTPVMSELREKRGSVLTSGVSLIDIGALDSGGFLAAARLDPIIFTYSLWRFFQEDADAATRKLCALSIRGGGKEVLGALELVLFDASPKINAFCLDYIITQMSVFVDTDRYLVKKAIKKMVRADFPASCRVVTRMYGASPRATMAIAKKLLTGRRMLAFNALIRPILRTHRP